MLILHQLHDLRPDSVDDFETATRDRWLPAVADVDGARLAWFARASQANRSAEEAATIMFFEDAAALARFVEAIKGTLGDIARELSGMRAGVETRVMRPLDYDPWSLSVSDIPAAPVDGGSVAYMHDFVPPVTGQMRGYITMMRERYMALSDEELSSVVLRASWQTVSGGGRQPEMFNLSEIRDAQALVNLLAYEIPAEYKEMGTWMWEALATRDRWTTRLMRSATWSPVK